MAYNPVSLIFNLNRTLDIGSVTFDAFVKEEHSVKMALTDIPVEGGRVVNDHSIMAPRVLNIQAIKSETPVTFGGSLGRQFNSIDSISNVFDNGLSFNDDSSTQWKALVEVLEERNELEIVTVLDSYSGMVLTGLSTVTDSETSKVLGVDMIFQEFRAVNEKTAIIPENKIADEKTSDQASADKDKGVVPIKEQPLESWAVQGVDSISESLGL